MVDLSSPLSLPIDLFPPLKSPSKTRVFRSSSAMMIPSTASELQAEKRPSADAEATVLQSDPSAMSSSGDSRSFEAVGADSEIARAGTWSNANTDVDGESSFAHTNGKFEGDEIGPSRDVRALSEPGSSYSAQQQQRDDGSVENSEMVLRAMRGSGYGFETGDMVWGKVKSHPWWPGHIFNEAFATSSVRRTRREGHVLVAFFGDSSYGWFDPAELIPFEPNYAEKSRQTTSRNFLKAVEEAVDEASRRSALGLACLCRSPASFRPSTVHGYFEVDVAGYEPGGIYSGKQIEKARDSFQPAQALLFVQQLACMPRDGDDSVDLIKNVAVVLAFRRAVFEEFDETYAQAFGMEPVRPSWKSSGESEKPGRVQPRAPLSGPLVVAEALGERKSPGKSLKVKDSSKKDKYLLKRREEPTEKKSVKQGVYYSGLIPSTVVPSLAFEEASSRSPSQGAEYVLQKRAPVVPEKHPFLVKPDSSQIANQDFVVHGTKSDSVGPSSSVSQTVLPVSSTDQAQYFGISPEFVAKEADMAKEMTRRMRSDETVQTSMTSDLVKKSESGGSVDAGRAVRQETETTSVEGSGQQYRVVENSGSRSLSVADGMRSSNLVTGKTMGTLPRPIGEDLSLEKYATGEKIKKKKKKMDSGLELGQDNQLKRQKIARDVEALGKSAGKSIEIGSAVQEQSKLDISNADIELPLLVDDLLALALDPFHAIERNSPTIVRHVFLKFRSLVYQKSLVLPSASESETHEPAVGKYVGGRLSQELSSGNAESTLSVDGAEASVLKATKPASRLDDPSKMGKKRSPSDRQGEMSAKRLKKVNELKQLALEKKTGGQKMVDGQKGEQKDSGSAAAAPTKSAKTDPVKKPELPTRATKPTAMSMKFPPKIGLPSANQLKAMFARFGSLDLSGTRVYWKSSTCRVVFKYKSDAEAAYNHAIRNNTLFGQVNVRYSLRELESPASELLEVNKPDDALQSRLGGTDAVEETRLTVLQQRRLPAVQLKSCLKKPSGDEAGPGPGIVKESPRVKFLLGGEDSRGDPMVVVSSTGNSNYGSSIDGASSSAMTFDVNIKNMKSTVILPPNVPLSRNPELPPPSLSPMQFAHQHSQTPDLLPQLLPPLLPLPHPSLPHTRDGHESHNPFSKVPHLAVHNKEVVEGRKDSLVDISHQMLSLLMRCSDIVKDVTSALGYVPYHPL